MKGTLDKYSRLDEDPFVKHSVSMYNISNDKLVGRYESIHKAAAINGISNMTIKESCIAKNPKRKGVTSRKYTDFKVYFRYTKPI